MPGIGASLVARELAIGVDGETVAAADHREHGVEPADVVVERQAADFHFGLRIARVEMAAPLVLQVRNGLSRPVPTAADIAGHAIGYVGLHPAAAETVGGTRHNGLCAILAMASHSATSMEPIAIKRLLAVGAGFFPAHHDGENFVRIEHAVVVKQRIRR